MKVFVVALFSVVANTKPVVGDRVRELVGTSTTAAAKCECLEPEGDVPTTNKLVSNDCSTVTGPGCAGHCEEGIIVPNGNKGSF